MAQCGDVCMVSKSMSETMHRTPHVADDGGDGGSGCDVVVTWSSCNERVVLLLLGHTLIRSEKGPFWEQHDTHRCLHFLVKLN